MKGLNSSTQLWLGAWELLQQRGDELFRLLTRGCKCLDLEAVHDLRVSSRRLREGLTLFAPCFPKRHLTSLRAQLKQLTRTLGAMRNTDEALLFFAQLAEVSAPAQGAAAGELVLALQAQRAEDRAALKKNLKAISPTALRLLFDQACNNPLIFNSKDIVPLQPVVNFLRTAAIKRETPLHNLYPQACLAGNVEAQHRLRIAVKRFRYRMEYCSFLAGPGYADLYAQTRGFQDVLGHLHDCEVFSSLVTSMVPEPLAQQALQASIDQSRQELFAEFLRQDAICPVTSLGERLRGLL